MKLYFLVLVGLVFSIHLNAQDLSRAERKVIAEKAISDLKDGTLILRLKSKHNKITELERLLAEPDVEESSRARLRKRLEETIDERNRYNLTLSNAFDTYYSFSNIYYMYDTASVSLRKGQRSGIFLDKNLELDPSIEIPEGSFFIVRAGTTDFSSTTGVQALVIMDQNLKDLQKPFPYYVRINSIGRLFVRIFNYKNLVNKDSQAVVQSLQKNLSRYYALYGGN